MINDNGNKLENRAYDFFQLINGYERNGGK